MEMKRSEVNLGWECPRLSVVGGGGEGKGSEVEERGEMGRQRGREQEEEEDNEREGGKMAREDRERWKRRKTTKEIKKE